MASASGRYRIVFNGEIYNHHALREQLQRRDGLAQPWRGHSDTETLLEAIEVWGLDGALQRCSGMFALALWDRQERRLHLARDRFGEKPLYWGWLDQAGQRVLVFASELAALRACPGGITPRLNPEALAAFFRAGCIPAPLSIYAGVHQLPPGHCLEFSSRTSSLLPGRGGTSSSRRARHLLSSLFGQHHRRPASLMILNRPSSG